MSDLVVIKPSDFLSQSPGGPTTSSGRRGVKSSISAVDSHPHQIGLYNNRQRILVVGDGNLSFSLSLASVLGGKNITATCYDSERVFREKYPSSYPHISSLEDFQAKVEFNVDATKLSEHKVLQQSKYDRIIFNFPHTGVEGSNQQSVESNQDLLLRFFISASLLLDVSGEIHVALRDTTFYLTWDIEQQAKDAHLLLQRKVEFKAEEYVGYECARTTSGELMRKAPSTEDAFTYCFLLAPSHPRMNLDSQRKERASQQQQEKKPKPPAEPQFRCEACATTVTGIRRWNGHINSSKHAKKVKEFKKKGGVLTLPAVPKSPAPFPTVAKSPRGSKSADKTKKPDAKAAKKSKLAASIPSVTPTDDDLPEIGLQVATEPSPSRRRHKSTSGGKDQKSAQSPRGGAGGKKPTYSPRGETKKQGNNNNNNNNSDKNRGKNSPHKQNGNKPNNSSSGLLQKRKRSSSGGQKSNAKKQRTF